MLIRLAVCGGMAAARLVELWFSRHNLEHQSSQREGTWSRRTFPLVVLLHSIVLGVTLLRGGRPRRLPLFLLLALQPLRIWILMTLGRRWNARGAVATDLAVATNGPYAYVRHPNYTVVAAELLALPLAFRLPRLALVAAALNAMLLAIRTLEEESMLFDLPGYAEHFRDKPRFLPRLF